MACPSSLGSLANTPSHIALDTVNGYVYVVLETSTQLVRYDYPTLANATTIITDASLAGATCDSSGNLYYVLNDGVGGDTTIYKRTPGGTTTTVSTGLGTTGAFGITWHPVDGQLYVAAQRFSSGNVSAVTKVDPSSGSLSFADTPTATPPFVSASGAPQATSDGGVWFFGGNIVYRIATDGSRTTSGSSSSGLSGNRTVIPLGTTVAIDHTSGDREYGPSTAATWAAYACVIAGDVQGAAHSDDWTTIVFVAGGTVYEITQPAAAGGWRVGRIGFPTTEPSA